MFYACLSARGQKKLKPLVSRHQLLYKISQEYIVHKDLLNAFDKGAFGDNFTRIKDNDFTLQGTLSAISIEKTIIDSVQDIRN